MKIIKLTRDYGFGYRTQDGILVDFHKCTIGKYNGKLFMSVHSEGKTKDGYNCITEEYLLEVTKEIKYHDTLRNVRILEEIEVDETQLSRTEVFYDFARKTKFDIDGSKAFIGYTFNQYWNGWDCPYFTKKVADNVCKEFSYKYNQK